RNPVEPPSRLTALPAPLGLARRGERAVPIDDAKSIEPRLQRVEAIEKRSRHLDRRQRPLSVKFEQRDGPGLTDFFFRCHRSPPGCHYPLIAARPQRRHPRSLAWFSQNGLRMLDANDKGLAGREGMISFTRISRAAVAAVVLGLCFLPAAWAQSPPK